MIETIVSVVGAGGGMAAIGGFIDFMMRSSEKKRLKGLLIEWWVRFDDVKLGNFGRQEASWFVKWLDRSVGARLLTARRWRFVALVASVLLAGSILWISLRYSLAWVAGLQSLPGRNAPNLFEGLWLFWAKTIVRPDLAVLCLFLALTLLFGLSFSLMRWAAVLVGRWAPAGWSGFLFFLLLVLGQIVVLLYWSTLGVTALVSVPIVMVFLKGSPQQIIAATLAEIGPKLSPGGRWEALWSPFVSPIGAASGPGHLMDIYKSELDLLANGLRIGFAAVFLASFLFQPVIKPFVSRLWEGIIDSDKPVFTMLLGGLGTVASLVAALVR